MGMFSDIGRSTAFQTGQGLLKDVLAVGAQERQGLMDSVTMKHQQDQLALAQQEETRKQEEYKYKTRTLLESDIMGKGEQSDKPNVAKFTLDLAKQMGLGQKIVNPDGTVDYKYRADELKQLVSDHYKDKSNEFHYYELQDAKLNLANIQAAYDKEKDPGKQAQIGEQLQQAQAKYSATREAYAGLHGKILPDAGMMKPKFRDDLGNVYSDTGVNIQTGERYDSQANGALRPIAEQEPKEPSNDFQTFMAGEKEKNPKATNAQISAAWHKLKMAEAAAAAAARGEGFAKSRPVQVIDTKTNRGKVLSLADVEVANRLEPGRYEPIAGSPDFKADTASLTNQVKVRDMMAGFIGNMNKQIDRMGEITKDVERFDARILNVPLVKARTMIKGSPQESKINMYLTEISSEMGKVASGASSSIAELSVETRKKWENIHDKNLSINDMMSLLRETQHAGKIRLQSSEQIISDTKKRFGGGNAGGVNTSDPYGIR